MLRKLINIILKLFTKHLCIWDYSNLEYLQGYDYDLEGFTLRKCKACNQEQKRIFYLNQEGGVIKSEWVDINA